MLDGEHIHLWFWLVNVSYFNHDKFCALGWCYWPRGDIPTETLEFTRPSWTTSLNTPVSSQWCRNALCLNYGTMVCYKLYKLYKLTYNWGAPSCTKTMLSLWLFLIGWWDLDVRGTRNWGRWMVSPALQFLVRRVICHSSSWFFHQKRGALFGGYPAW